MDYTEDYLGVDFVKQTLALRPDKEGAVCCTLVKALAVQMVDRSVLYVHGFRDYFFQKELAHKWQEQGYNFYAVDLRKCGRSLLPTQTPCNLYDISDYYEDLDAAIAKIHLECKGRLVINAHSTGALAVLLYLAHRPTLECSALVLNSPFVEMNKGWYTRKIAIPFISAWVRIRPDHKVKKSLSPFYGQSLSKDAHGEWDYNQTWKPIAVGDVNASWLRAIHKAHRELRKGLHLACPILVMHSARSFKNREWSDDFMQADAVLNVEHIKRYAHCAGSNVTIIEIEGGLHDLVLSNLPVREKVYSEMFGWLERIVNSE